MLYHTRVKRRGLNSLLSKIPIALVLLCCLSACNTAPAPDQEAEAQARAELIKTYNQHKARIERVAQMEQDLSQLLQLLSESNQISSLEQQFTQTDKPVITHQATGSENSATHQVDGSHTHLVQFGRHLRSERANAQNRQIEQSLQLMQSYYPDMFKGVSIFLQQPGQNGTRFYETRASGFLSKQESQLFCRLIKASGQPCKLVN
ncbi:hypothetical protein C3B51_13070 [Pseudoalteromonas rubra]|uniref:SPOR domain-containing protein n=1 Tax=Pseudoalteromonas rubra TaxID=43658 RepID=A0A4Q7EBQ7_9GAMM|nr:hypothetical protein [Pseudoalteromonas rubra]RZM80104.1 hypothetical protein C3B51_13070 [Pseudoalteromonas rubra]